MNGRQEGRKPLGISLLEVLIVMSVVFSVVAYIGRSAMRANEAKTLHHAVVNWNEITTSLRTGWFQSNGLSYTGLTTATAIGAGVIPEGMVFGSAIRHSWGGGVYLRSPSRLYFQLDYRNLPQLACRDLILKLNDTTRLWVNGSWRITPTARDVTSQTALTWCSQPGATNRVIWRL